MYSDLIDSTKSSKNSPMPSVKAENFLFQCLLNGNKPTLTLSQAMDSSVILSIAQNSKQGKHFIDAISKGYIRISLFGQVESLQGYILKTLKSNVDSEASQFMFSNMPFLYDQYSEVQRKKVFSALMLQIQEGNPSFNSSLVLPEHKDYIEQYIETIRTINFSAKKAYLPATSNTKQLNNIISNRILERQNTLQENRELYKLLNSIRNNANSNYRTFYYNLLKQYADYYSPENIQEARELIDFCYNETVASSISDNEPANLNIPNTLSELCAAASGFSGTTSVSKNEIVLTDENREYLDWERLLIILSEVESIQQKKACDWQTALNTYYKQQQRLPFVIGTKYASISALTLAISSVPVIGGLLSNFATELIWNSVCDVLGEVTKKPSFENIVSAAKESDKRCKLIKLADSNTTFEISG